MNTTASGSSLELQNRRTLPIQSQPVESLQPQVERNEGSDDAAVIQHHIEPADRGSTAWKLLGAAFVFEALLWGKRV